MYGQPTFELDAEARTIRTRFRLNGSTPSVIGYQIFDPETGTFIAEGEWQKVEDGAVDLQVTLPPERGRYHVYISPVDEQKGWDYGLGKPFVLIDALVDEERAELVDGRETTLGSLRRSKRYAAAGKLFTLPITALWRHRRLIQSMVKRDIASRYRGSFGDVLWTILNPLLLMSTYFFVFGIVLESRLGPNNSRTDFVLYFLAGILPWLAFSEASGRSAHVLIEHRNFIKKLVFPVEILPVSQVFAGLVTEGFALLVFTVALLIIQHRIPLSSLWLPALLIPQLLFTLGVCWFLSALGVFLRDLGQIIGLLLTLWFFLTPICYPETSIPPAAAELLTRNPIYVLVRGYRAIFLEGSAPAFHSLWKLWLLAVVVFLGGYGWFHKLRRSFADVI